MIKKLEKKKNNKTKMIIIIILVLIFSLIVGITIGKYLFEVVNAK